ncbi:MAG TPA: beta-ketoacyl-ACP synthase III [Gemmatimonadales bacterium]|nr:beta-ketoacyl-ACP synthase III [Gemmatimonadales bacterium]
MRSRILGTGMAVPDRVVTNDDLAAIMDTTDEWIVTRTGIRERRWVRPGDMGVDLALAAAVRAIAAAGLEPTDLDAILLATSSPDHFAPGNGVFLQHKLGVGRIPALDIRAQCAGFVYGVATADAYIRAGLYRRVLVVGQELQSSGMDVSTEGRNTAVIFADGAGAVVLGATDEDRGVLAVDLHSDGAYADKLWVDVPGAMYNPRQSREHEAGRRHYLQMDGREVFRHAVVRMPESVRAVLGTLQLGPEALALLIPHQANLRISEMVQKELGLRDDQVYNNIQRYGNTTAATIPIALDECVRAGRLQPGDLVAFTAFGSGFMWGSVALRW